MSEHDTQDGLSKWEICVGFAGSDRETWEVVEATSITDAHNQATEGHGATAIVKQSYELDE